MNGPLSNEEDLLVIAIHEGRNPDTVDDADQPLVDKLCEIIKKLDNQ